MQISRYTSCTGIFVMFIFTVMLNRASGFHPEKNKSLHDNTYPRLEGPNYAGRSVNILLTYTTYIYFHYNDVTS